MPYTITKNEMNNQEAVENKQELSEFEQLLDEFTYNTPKRGQIKEGEIKYMDEDSIILDLGLKRDAVVYSREINQLDDDYFHNLSVGDVIPISIVRAPVGDDDLVVSIADALEYQNWKEVKNIQEEGDVVEIKVIGRNKGGLLVQFNQIEGFLPNSHISGLKKFRSREELSKKKEEMQGEEIQVTPIEVDRENQRLVFSARIAEKSVQEHRLEEIKEGEVLTGKVANIVDFGVFVDLDGVDGLVHVSELAWKRVKHPSNVVDIGDDIEVLVMKVEPERNRIQLSRKALMQGPWDRIESNYVPGDLVEVKIVNVVDFGAFAQLPEGIHGLIHISELGYTPAGDPLKTIERGDEVLVKILNIDRNRERVSLSMRQVPLEAQYDWALSKEADHAREDSVEGKTKKEAKEFIEVEAEKGGDLKTMKGEAPVLEIQQAGPAKRERGDGGESKGSEPIAADELHGDVETVIDKNHRELAFENETSQIEAGLEEQVSETEQEVAVGQAVEGETINKGAS